MDIHANSAVGKFLFGFRSMLADIFLVLYFSGCNACKKKSFMRSIVLSCYAVMKIADIMLIG